MKHPVARRAVIPVPFSLVGGTSAGEPRHAQAAAGPHHWPEKLRGERLAAVITLTGAVVIAIVSAAWLSTTSGAVWSGAAVPTLKQDSVGSGVGASQASDRPSMAGATTARGDGKTDGMGPAEKQSIQVKTPVRSAKPYEAVPISGTQPGSRGTLLQVQRSEGGKWVAFPLPTRTDHSGQFTTYVELGKAGRYSLRVLDPRSGATSKPLPLVIKA